MKQQLTLAIAYATGARYLLLDEPMNALDPSRVDLHSEILRKLADSGTCIIMSSHILDSVDRLCDEILFLKDGRLIEAFRKMMLRRSLLDPISQSLADAPRVR